VSQSGSLLLALDFGGTKLSAAVAAVGPLTAGDSVDASGAVAVGAVAGAQVAGSEVFGGPVTTGSEEAPGWLALERRASPPGSNAESDLRIAVELARAALAGRRPAAVGVSFGGPVWHETGVVKLSHHVPGWEGVALAERLSGEFGVPVVVENDGIIAALGEHRFGAGRGASSLLYITVSTGVGGGIVLDGRILHGADGMAGHVGHLRLERDGPPCVCGSRGCLEAIAAGPAIAAEARRRIALDPDGGADLLASVDGDVSAITAHLLADAASKGDQLALGVIERAATALGAGIGSAANLLNPERVLVGGGVSKAGPALWNVMRRVARETAMPEVSLELAPAGLADDAPLWGAIALAADHLAGPARTKVGDGVGAGSDESVTVGKETAR
jgi:glucokinase